MNALNILRGYAAKLDVAGAVGISLAVFAIALYVSAVVPARADIDRLQAHLARAAQRDPAASRDTAAVERSASQLEQFTQRFPSLKEAPGWILQMHKVAAHNGLTLDSGEYRLLKDREGGMARYQITLPLHGGYAQVREFLAQVLDQVPAATLEEVTIKRDNVDARVTETRVRLIMYLAD